MEDIMSKRLQMLISAVDKDSKSLLEQMNIESDAILVNQFIKTDGGDFEEELQLNGHTVKVIGRREKGVGLSRNTALENSDHEIIQFADDDIVYDQGYAEKILKEFDDHPEADVIMFNVRAQEGRETYWNEDFAKVTWKNYGRYPAYAICARRDKLVSSGVKYSLLFGGGAPYMNGEDSLFLHDCLKSGLSLYRTTVALGHEVSGESTWFNGYTDKFFYDRGVLYHFLYGSFASILGFRYLFNNRKTMCVEKGLFKSYHLLNQGIKHAKTLKKV